ncbi:MAG TPA: hypothetical protein VNX86_03500 [Rhizomicrobium sp.]|jgi:hypothetical protein|nr:hypothetical protein [Rhizomicrobium sp.]
MTIQAVGFFCEDVRAERESLFSIIGVMPETANLNEFVPGRTILPRLALYIRVHFDLDDIISSISLRLQMPGNAQIVDVGAIDDSIIRASFENGRKANSPMGSVFMRIDMSPFPIPALGWLKAFLSVDGREMLVAILRFATGEASNPGLEITRHVTAPIASERPS